MSQKVCVTCVKLANPVQIQVGCGQVRAALFVTRLVGRITPKGAAFSFLSKMRTKLLARNHGLPVDSGVSMTTFLYSHLALSVSKELS